MLPDSWMDMTIIRIKPSLRGIEIKCLTEWPYCGPLFSWGVIHAYVCCHSDEVLSSVYIVPLRINSEHDKMYFTNYKLIYYTT